MAAYGNKLLVSMSVSNTDGAGGQRSTPRWQVLTVQDGRICDIRGYEREVDARAALAPPTS